jgi:hypothetical protein
VRTSGLLTDLRAVGPYEHLCWAFEDAQTYRSQVWKLLDAGQRVFLITSDSGLPVEPAATPAPMAKALGSGQARLVPVESIHSRPVTPWSSTHPGCASRTITP